MEHENLTSYTEAQKRQAEYIKESFKRKGLSNEAAELVAWATVKKESHICIEELLSLLQVEK
jgi:hypothetical protein